jgi:hypothetical protein
MRAGLSAGTGFEEGNGTMNRGRSGLRSTLTLAAAVFVLGAAGIAQAGTITLERDKGSNGYSGDNGGGEMGVSAFTGGPVVEMGAVAKISGLYFQTFCIERNEFFTPGESYQWTVSGSAHNGGVGGQTSPGADPVSAATAYLYTQFYFGLLSNYNYTLGSGRKSSATELQNAIWFLENEISGLGPSSQAQLWVSEAREATDGDGYLDNWVGGMGNVRVLTITDASANNKQDQLFMVPLPPAAFMGLGGLAGLGMIGYLRRRRNSI